MEGLKVFRVKFEFVGGEKKKLIIKSDSYGNVASAIMRSKDGWFGIQGEIVNLSNVTTCRIEEVSEYKKDDVYDILDDIENWA